MYSLLQVLVGFDPAMALVQVQDQLAIQAFFNHELVHANRVSRCDRNRDVTSGKRLPASRRAGN